MARIAGLALLYGRHVQDGPCYRFGAKPYIGAPKDTGLAAHIYNIRKCDRVLTTARDEMDENVAETHRKREHFLYRT